MGENFKGGNPMGSYRMGCYNVHWYLHE